MSAPASRRVYERDTDALFLRKLRDDPVFTAAFCRLAGVGAPTAVPSISAQVRHAADSGSIDIVVRFHNGPRLLIENKIDAAYSVTGTGAGQPQRYRRSVEAFRSAGSSAQSVLLAPNTYLQASRGAELFDVRVAYEDLRTWLSGDDLALLDVAIAQAEAPYEPVPNTGAACFFADMRALVGSRYPALAMKRDPNADGVRPEDSRTVYFDVPRTLRPHAGVPKPRMSLQCWDSAAPSASAKIMLTGRAAVARSTERPQSVADIGAYLRAAGGSLGIVIDTPRLDTQRALADQLGDVTDALEATLRLQAWWHAHPDVLREWLRD